MEASTKFPNAQEFALRKAQKARQVVSVRPSARMCYYKTFLLIFEKTLFDTIF